MKWVVGAAVAGSLVVVLVAWSLWARIGELEHQVGELGEGAGPPKPASQKGDRHSASEISREHGPEGGDSVTSGAKDERVPAIQAALAGLAERLKRVEAKLAVPKAAEEPGNVPDPELRGQVAQLSAEVSRLRAAVDALRAQQASLTPSELLARQESVQAISDLVQQQLEKRQEERRASRQAMGDQFVDELVQDFSSRASMSDEQFAQLYPVVKELQTAVRDNWRAMRRGEKDFSEVRTGMREARQRLDTAARQVLNDKQYKLYEQEIERHLSGPGGMFR